MKDRSRHTREQLRKEADIRLAERNQRTPSLQIAHLDAILGKGVGATRERARLADLIADAKGQRITKPENLISVPK